MRQKKTQNPVAPTHTSSLTTGRGVQGYCGPGLQQARDPSKFRFNPGTPPEEGREGSAATPTPTQGIPKLLRAVEAERASPQHSTQ